MATWEEILAADYNPVTHMREQHQEKMAKRKAENLARMQAANPGFLPGGLANPDNNQYQQFASPSVMSNQASWLGSQREVGEQLWGSSTNPDTPPNAAVGTNGTYTPQGAFQASNGPNSAGVSGGISDAPQGFQDAYGAVAGGIPAGFHAGLMAIDPIIGGLLTPFRQTEADAALQQDLDSMVESLGGYPDIGALPESHISPDIPGVGLPSGMTGGNGTGGNADNSGFGGGGGQAISEGNQGAAGNEGPGQGNGSGGSAGAGAGGNANGGGSAAGGPDGGR